MITTPLSVDYASVNPTVEGGNVPAKSDNPDYHTIDVDDSYDVLPEVFIYLILKWYALH